MSPKLKLTKLFHDEAKCKDDDSPSHSSDDSEGSLVKFIAADDAADSDDTLEDTGDESFNSSVSSGSKVAPKKKVAGRPPKNAAKVKAFTSKPPGHPTFPTNDFSLTVTKTKDDVGLDSLEAVAQFIETHCIKGGVSTEVGQRVFQLHLQGVFKMHWPAAKDRTQELQKIIKALLPSKGKGYKVMVKVCKGGQNFSAMIGYITKDQGQAHYQYRLHNVTRQELSFGRRDHDALLTSYDDSKKILTTKNMFNECYRFNMRCLHPAVAPIHYALLYMVQSGSYMFSSDFISVFRKTDLNEARILWNIVHNPGNATLADVMSLIFNPLSYGKKETKRYYMAGAHRLDIEENHADVTAAASSSTTSAASDPLVRVNNILDIARSRTTYSDGETSLLPDYVQLPDATVYDAEYTIDRNPSTTAGDVYTGNNSMECPEKLEDMLVIVRALRESRFQATQMMAHVITPAPVERVITKSRLNNTKVTNMSDLLAGV